MTTTQPQPPETSTRRPPLRRSTTVRTIAGVAGGIARSTGISVGLVRLGFVLSTLFGGAGLLLYLVGWIAIPEDGAERSLVEEWLGGADRPRAWLGIGAVLLGALLIADRAGFGGIAVGLALMALGALVYTGRLGALTSAITNHPSEEDTMTTQTPSGSVGLADPARDDTVGTPPPPPTTPPPVETPVPAAPVPPRPRRPKSILGRLTFGAMLIVLGTMALLETTGAVDLRPRHYFAAALAVVGVGLVVGTFAGRSRGLIAVGIVLIPFALASPLAEVQFDGFDVRLATPSTVQELTDYSMDAGTLVVDLREIDPAGLPVDVTAHVDLGRLVVVVPASAAVDGTADVNLGSIDLFGTRSGGIGDITENISKTGESGTFVLDVSVDVGSVEVTTSRPEFSGQVLPWTASTGTSLNSGSRVVTVTDAADLASSYRSGTGRLVLDLSSLTLTEPRSVSVDMGAGDITVLVPREMSMSVTASAAVGDVTLPDSHRGGFGVNLTHTEPSPMLRLDIQVGTGSITVEER